MIYMTTFAWLIQGPAFVSYYAFVSHKNLCPSFFQDIFDFAYDRKGQQTVGLTLAPCKDYEAFVIETIHPSGIVSSKPLQASEKRPQAHDWIIEINGQKNNKKDMSKRLAAERVLMKLCRYDLES